MTNCAKNSGLQSCSHYVRTYTKPRTKIDKCSIGGYAQMNLENQSVDAVSVRTFVKPKAADLISRTRPRWCQCAEFQNLLTGLLRRFARWSCPFGRAVYETCRMKVTLHKTRCVTQPSNQCNQRLELDFVSCSYAYSRRLYWTAVPRASFYSQVTPLRRRGDSKSYIGWIWVVSLRAPSEDRIETEPNYLFQRSYFCLATSQQVFSICYYTNNTRDLQAWPAWHLDWLANQNLAILLDVNRLQMKTYQLCLRLRTRKREIQPLL